MLSFVVRVTLSRAQTKEHMTSTKRLPIYYVVTAGDILYGLVDPMIFFLPW